MLVETIFFRCLRHLLRRSSSRLVETHFSVQKKTIIFYYELFFCLWKPLFKLKRSLFKTLYHYYWQRFSLIFQILLPIEANFSFSRNVFLNKLIIPATGNQFSVYLKQYSFIWTFFSLLEIQFLKNNFIPGGGNWSSGW